MTCFSRGRCAPVLRMGVAVMMLGGCEAGRFDAGPVRTPQERRAAFPIPHEDYARLGYRLDWVGYPVQTGSLPVEHLEPYDDIVVALEAGSTVSVLETGTGARRCSDQLSSPLTRFAGLERYGDHLLVCADDEVFFLDPRTCHLTARQKLARIVRTPPVRYGNLLIFGTGTGELFAHMTSVGIGGVKAWGFAIQGAIEHRPVLVGSVVGAVSQRGEVLFVEAESGALVGRNSIHAGLATDPVADEQAMYVASLDQSIYAFAPMGATLVWRYRTAAPLRVQPTIHAGRLYCAVAEQGLTAFEADSGRVLWTCPAFNGTVMGVVGGRLLGFNPASGEGVLLDPARGDVIERVRLPGVSFLRLDRFENGNLYVVSHSGLVARFIPR